MRAIAFIALTALLVACGYAAQASRRAADRAALEQARRETAQATARFQALDRQARLATDAAQRARAEGEALTARLEAAEADLTAAERRIGLLEAGLADQRARLAAHQQPLVRLTAALQTRARRPAALALVQPGSVQDTLHVRALLAATLPEIRRRTAALRAEVRRSAALRRQTDEARVALIASREELQRRRTALASFEAAQRARSQALGGLALAESDRALVFGEQARALSALIGTRRYQRRLAASLAALPGPVPRPGTTPETGRARLPYRLPVEGRLVTGVGEISEGGVHSRGLTVATASEASIVAPSPGRIRYAAPFRGYGNIVIIDHGGGWTTLITNLATLEVRVGQGVRGGAPLGRAESGDARVTVELRHDGQPMPIAQLIAG